MEKKKNIKHSKKSNYKLTGKTETDIDRGLAVLGVWWGAGGGTEQKRKERTQGQGQQCGDCGRRRVGQAEEGIAGINGDGYKIKFKNKTFNSTKNQII